MSTLVVHRVRAAFPMEKEQILPLLAGSKAIYAAMLAELARFPNPVPTLAILLGEINTLESTQAVVATRAGGAATAARNTARDALWVSLQSEKAYVQTIADADEANAVQIIKSAGFDVAASATRSKPLLDAKLTGVSGVVKLEANASLLTGGSKKRPSYSWQYSVDGGHTWVTAPGTPRATTLIAGLPVMTNCSFRVTVTLGTVMQPWSQVITIPVV